MQLFLSRCFTTSPVEGVDRADRGRAAHRAAQRGTPARIRRTPARATPRPPGTPRSADASPERHDHSTAPRRRRPRSPPAIDDPGSSARHRLPLHGHRNRNGGRRPPDLRRRRRLGRRPLHGDGRGRRALGVLDHRVFPTGRPSSSGRVRHHRARRHRQPSPCSRRPSIDARSGGLITGGGVHGTAYPGADVTVRASNGATCRFPADSNGSWGCVLSGLTPRPVHRHRHASALRSPGSSSAASARVPHHRRHDRAGPARPSRAATGGMRLKPARQSPSPGRRRPARASPSTPATTPAAPSSAPRPCAAGVWWCQRDAAIGRCSLSPHCSGTRPAT